MSMSETALTTPAKERHHEDLISVQSPPLTAPSTTTSAPHPSEVGGQMRHVQRITNDRRRDHLLAPSRQLAMHGIVRKLDVPRRNWLVCYMSVRHLREPECSSNYQAAGSICQARQAYQLMHNTQGAARSAPHVDTHVHSGAPVDLRTSAPTARLRRVSSRFVQSDEYLFPSRTKAGCTQTSNVPTALRGSCDWSSSMSYHWAAAAVPFVSPRSWLDGDAHVVCATPPARTREPTHTRTRCHGEWLLWTAYASRLVI